MTIHPQVCPGRLQRSPPLPLPFAPAVDAKFGVGLDATLVTWEHDPAAEYSQWVASIDVKEALIVLDDSLEPSGPPKFLYRNELKYNYNPNKTGYVVVVVVVVVGRVKEDIEIYGDKFS